MRLGSDQENFFRSPMLSGTLSRASVFLCLEQRALLSIRRLLAILCKCPSNDKVRPRINVWSTFFNFNVLNNKTVGSCQELEAYKLQGGLKKGVSESVNMQFSEPYFAGMDQALTHQVPLSVPFESFSRSSETLNRQN